MNLFHSYKGAIIAVVIVVGLMILILINTVGRRSLESEPRDYNKDSYSDFIEVSGSSMEPTFHNGDLVYYNTKVEAESVKIGRIIIFYNPNKDGSLLIKRVVSNEGTVSIKDNVLYVDGFLTPYGIETTNADYYIHDASWDVKEDYVFVVGDNYDNSIDSRSYGPIATSSIVGLVKE